MRGRKKNKRNIKGQGLGGKGFGVPSRLEVVRMIPFISVRDIVRDIVPLVILQDLLAAQGC